MPISPTQSGLLSGAGPTLSIPVPSPLTPGNLVAVWVRLEASDGLPGAGLDGVVASSVGWQLVRSDVGFVSFLHAQRIVPPGGDPRTEFVALDVEASGFTITSIEAAWAEFPPPPGLVHSHLTNQSTLPSQTVSPASGITVFSAEVWMRSDRDFMGTVGLGLEVPGAAPGSIDFGSLDEWVVAASWPASGIEFFGFHAASGSTLGFEWDTGVSPSVLGSTGYSIPSSSQFSVVQDLQDPTMMAVPSAGNLLVFTAWTKSTDGIDPPVVDLAGWDEFHVFVADEANAPDRYVLTTYWKEADGTEASSDFAPVLAGATGATLTEITGFSMSPVLHGSADWTFQAEDGLVPSDYVLWPDPDVSEGAFVVTIGFSTAASPDLFEALPWFDRLPTTDRNFTASMLQDVLLTGVPVAPVGEFFDGDGNPSAGTGAVAFGVWIDAESPTPPTPTSSARFDFCPKSIKALAMRLTRQNSSGATLDPLVPYSRIQSSGFAELGIDLDYEVGSETVVRSPSGTVPAIIDKGITVLKGLELKLKLCGMPFSVLEMLCGIVPLDPSADLVRAAAFRDGFDPECKDPVMLELWSKNAQATCPEERWIHWLVPLTLDWRLSSGLNFSNGSLDIELSGYGRQNPAWTPSFPGEAFPSWVPGAGDPDGWPVGVAGPVLPDDVVADGWTLAEMAGVRSAGPIAYRLEENLPEPLDDCNYIFSPDCLPESFSDDFCGEAGPVGDPWENLPTPGGSYEGAQILQMNGSCQIEQLADPQVGSVPLLTACCGETCQTISMVVDLEPIEVEGITYVTFPYPIFSLDDGHMLLLSSLAFYDGVAFTLGVTAVIVELGGDVVAVAQGFTTITSEAFYGTNLTVQFSWCPDGTVRSAVAGEGGFSAGFTFTGFADYLPGVLADRAGVIFGPLETWPMSPMSGFSLTCGDLPESTEYPFGPIPD